MIQKKQSFGFTLIEFLLYITIVTSMLWFMSESLMSVLFDKQKSLAIREVNYALRLVVSDLERMVAAAEDILILPGASLDSMTLDMPSVADDPTVYGLNAERVYRQSGNSNAVFLTPASVSVSNLTFTNVTDSSGAEAIRFNAVFSAQNPEDTQANAYTKTLLITIPAYVLP